LPGFWAIFGHFEIVAEFHYWCFFVLSTPATLHASLGARFLDKGFKRGFAPFSFTSYALPLQ